MDWIVVSGVRPYDERYEFDVIGQDFTTREWGWIKRLADYLPLTIGAGFAGRDPELFAVFAVIALRRAGKIANGDVPDVYDTIIDAPAGSTITLDSDRVDDEQDEDDASPPATSSNE